MFVYLNRVAVAVAVVVVVDGFLKSCVKKCQEAIVQKSNTYLDEVSLNTQLKRFLCESWYIYIKCCVSS